jgi:hypothetical protein
MPSEADEPGQFLHSQGHGLPLRRCSAEVRLSINDRRYFSQALAICVSPPVPANARIELVRTVSLHKLKQWAGTKVGTIEWL